MKVLLVAGARPNFMKIAPVLRALASANCQAVLVHTGQHYDDSMSAAFFRDLEIREPDYNLGVGSGSHAFQTARVMEAFEPVLLRERPQWVLVVGDVNSTLACALVTSKLRHEIGCRLGHVEAGLRSRDWRMPEEVNRVLTDQVSDLLFTPSRDADANLAREGIAAEKIRFVGNVMVDTLFYHLPGARERGIAKELGVSGRRYAVVTLHRPSNVDDRPVLELVLRALARQATELPVVFPVHPRTRQRIQSWGLGALIEPLVAVDPLGYLDMISLLDGAAVVLTDSGGVQEETTALGVPCVTLREQTERPITVEQGTNRLAPWPLSVEGIAGSVSGALASGSRNGRRPEGWDGRAASRIIEAVLGL